MREARAAASTAKQEGYATRNTSVRHSDKRIPYKKLPQHRQERGTEQGCAGLSGPWVAGPQGGGHFIDWPRPSSDFWDMPTYFRTP